MANRQEFTKPVRREILKRAKAPNGIGWVCENCGAFVTSGEVHHLKMDAIKLPKDKQKPLTAADGQFWCDPCHDPETARQRKVLSKAIRQEDRSLGISRSSGHRQIQSRGFARPEKRQRSDRFASIDYSQLPFGKGK